MRGSDVDGLRGRLAQQGVRDVDIALYGSYDDTKAATKTRTMNNYASGNANASVNSNGMNRVGSNATLSSNKKG